MVYVETDLLGALIKDDEWLRESAITALEEHEEIYTSILSYAEVLVLFYDRDSAEYDIDVARAVTNLLELVPVTPAEHEEAILAAATFIEEDGLTSFDALHAGLVTAREERVLSTEQDYDTVSLARIPLAPDSSQE